ncbi:formin-like protein [Vespula maculifrons]|uniref:Formin-like protein n=1 Tax=Vespula maculifrons TaxID=7453 RepID=A0ABD2CFD8_VESMC
MFTMHTRKHFNLLIKRYSEYEILKCSYENHRNFNIIIITHGLPKCHPSYMPASHNYKHIFILILNDAVINELKNKTRLVQEKKLLQQDEVYNGALEDILLGLRSEPYRRADAVRRSQRRRIDNHRLSRTAEELEL